MTQAPQRSSTRLPGPAVDTVPPSWSRWWPTVVLVSTIAVAIASLLGAPEVVRAPIVVWFLAVCPGMAVVRLVRLDDPIAELMLALAVSLALAGLVPAVFLYLGAWSTGWSLVVLLAITAVGLALDPLLAPDRQQRGPAPATLSRDVGPLGTVLGADAVRPMATGRIRPPHARPMTAFAGPLPDPAKARTEPSIEDAPSAALMAAFDRVIAEIADRRRRED